MSKIIEMIIAGAKGLAKELLEILAEMNTVSDIYFFDNVSADCPKKLFDRFPIVRSFGAVEEIFNQLSDKSFSLGLGGPLLRYRLCQEFLGIGGILTSIVSTQAHVGQFGTIIGSGCCVLPGAIITANVQIGQGCLINPNATISHDSVLGNFVEVSPGANITGNCAVGDFSFIGSNAAILPKVVVGKNVVVGAGAVVTRDIPDNCVVAGVPAVVKRKLDPLNY